jgi:hypothetical protein
MDMMTIFGLQFVLSLGVSALLIGWYVSPWLNEMPLEQALTILILPHTIRHLGLVFLVPGVVDAGLPTGFATVAGYGDFIAGLLAIIAVVALRYNLWAAMAFVWLFNLIGTADLINALRHVEAVPFFGAAWYIPTFLVPVLLVSHAMIFARLIRQTTRPVALT